MDLKFKLFKIIFSDAVYAILFKVWDRILYPLVKTADLKKSRAFKPVPINKIVQVSDLANPDWKDVLDNMSHFNHLDEPSFHRKDWEYVQIVYALKQNGYLFPDNTGLAIGAGREGILYYLADKVKQIIGIDLYQGTYLGGEDEIDIPNHPEKYAPFVYDQHKLKLVRMDSRDLNFQDNRFDFVFSASSIEHFGNQGEIETALSEIFRVLKPGGACALTTEVGLNRLATNIPNTAVFKKDQLLKMFEKCGFELTEDTVDMQIEEEYFKKSIKLPICLFQRPHVILRFFNTYFTSIFFLLKKPGNLVDTGLWKKENTHRPFDYQGIIEAKLTADLFSWGDNAAAEIYLKNTSNFDWFTNGYSHRIAIGVQLLDENKNLLDLNYGEIAIPSPLKCGEGLHFQTSISITVPAGNYFLQLDLKRELIAWFSHYQAKPFLLPLRIK